MIILGGRLKVEREGQHLRVYERWHKTARIDEGLRIERFGGLDCPHDRPCVVWTRAGLPVSAWRHRDGGFVFQVYGGTWILEISLAVRRRDRFGVRKPFAVTLTTGLTET